MNTPQPPVELDRRMARRERRGALYRRYLLASGTMLGLLLVVNLVLFRMDGVDFIFGAGVLVCGMCVAYQFYGRTMRILVVLWIALTLPFWFLTGWLGWQMAVALKSGPLPEHPFRSPPPEGAVVDFGEPPGYMDSRFKDQALHLKWYLNDYVGFHPRGIDRVRTRPSGIKGSDLRDELYPALDAHLSNLAEPGILNSPCEDGICSAVSEEVLYAQLGRIAGLYRAQMYKEAAAALNHLIRAECARLQWARVWPEFMNAAKDLAEIQFFLYQVCPELLAKEEALIQASFDEISRVARLAKQVALQVTYEEARRSQAESGSSMDFPYDALMMIRSTGPRPFLDGFGAWAAHFTKRRWRHWPLRENALRPILANLQDMEAGTHTVPPNLTTAPGPEYDVWEVETLVSAGRELESLAAAHQVVERWYADPAALAELREVRNPHFGHYLLVQEPVNGVTHLRLTIMWGYREVPSALVTRERVEAIRGAAINRPAFAPDKVVKSPASCRYAFEIVRPAQSVPKNDD